MLNNSRPRAVISRIYSERLIYEFASFESILCGERDISLSRHIYIDIVDRRLFASRIHSHLKRKLDSES